MKIKSVLEGILVRNLVENPSYEVDTSGVSLDAGLSMTLNTSTKVVGAQSLRVVATSGAANKSVFVTKVDGTLTPILASTVYTVSAYFIRGSGGSGPIVGQIGIEWYDATEVLISRAFGLGITANSIFGLSTGEDWARKGYTAESPINAAFARLFFEDNGSAWVAPMSMHCDGWMFNEGGLEDYIDGSLPGCSWDDVPDAGTSKRQIKRVYENPPNTLQDVPCFIIYPAGLKPERRMGGWRVNQYNVLIRMVAHDSDWDRAAAIMEAYRELVISAFDGSIQLDGHATLIDGPEAEPAIQFPYGDRNYLGMDFRLGVRTDDSIEYVS